MNWLPYDPNGSAQTSILAFLHAPILWWFLLGLAFAGAAWPAKPSRIEYLRYNGEAVVYGSLILLGGMVLTGVTAVLFELIQMDIQQWYVDNIVLLGLVAAPLVATVIVPAAGGRADARGAAAWRASSVRSFWSRWWSTWR